MPCDSIPESGATLRGCGTIWENTTPVSSNVSLTPSIRQPHSGAGAVLAEPHAEPKEDSIGNSKPTCIDSR